MLGDSLVDQGDRVDCCGVDQIGNYKLLALVLVYELTGVSGEGPDSDYQVGACGCQQGLVSCSLHLVYYASVALQIHHVLACAQVEHLYYGCFSAGAGCQQVVAYKLHPEAPQIL